MKKNKKLALGMETVRQLTTQTLERIGGALSGYACKTHQSDCGGLSCLHCDSLYNTQCASCEFTRDAC